MSETHPRLAAQRHDYKTISDLDAVWIVGPPLLEVFDAFEPLAILRELQHGVLVIDIVGGVSVRCVQIVLTVARAACWSII